MSRQALPDGTTTEGFQILRPLGEGGFGIVYLAWDPVLERHVAIKEYMPSALALRDENSLAVAMRSERHRDTFEAGLKSFLNEARLLAKFDHPALLKVFRFWEANGTAYMAMPYYEGPTLKEALAGEPTPPTEEQLRNWLNPLLDALSIIHRENCLHRDISPDNILLTSTGPVLLDFGAARRVIHDMTQSLTAVLKPGFAPIEQYGGVMNQGPWTDLYALAGVVYYAITGQLPPASAARVVSDGFKPLGETHGGRYTDRFLHAIDAALSLRPQARPQDAMQFRALMQPSPAGDLPSASMSASASALEPATKAPLQTWTQTEVESAVEAERHRHTGLKSGPEPEFESDFQSEREGATAFAAFEPAAPRLAASEALSTHSGSVVRRKTNWRTSALALVFVLALVFCAAWWLGTKPAPASAEGPASVVAPVAAPSANALQLPMNAVESASPSANQATPMPSKTAVVESPKKDLRDTAAPRRGPAAAARPVVRIGAAAPAPEPSAAVSTVVETSPALSAASRAQRCSDLVLKSSLESLSTDEVTFQKNQCK